MAIAGIDDNVVLVCWQNASYGICATVSEMTSGIRQVLSGVSNYIVVAKFDTLKGIVCYQVSASALHCKAAVVSSGDSLRLYTGIVLSDSLSTWLSMSTFPTDSVILCWVDVGLRQVACFVINASGTVLSAGNLTVIVPSKLFTHCRHWQGPLSVTVAKVNTNKATACYATQCIHWGIRRNCIAEL